MIHSRLSLALLLVLLGSNELVAQSPGPQREGPRAGGPRRAPPEQRAAGRTGVLKKTEQASPGYTLLAPLNSTDTRLIDLDGQVIHTWPSDVRPGNSVYLMDDGSLLRTGKVSDNPVFAVGGGSGGRIQRVSWDGKVMWDFSYSTEDYLQHHDIEPLPNGNVLLIAWEKRSKQEAIQAGREPQSIGVDRRSAGNAPMLWPEVIVEIKPQGQTGGEVVWQWKLWDHLIQNMDESKDNFGDPAKHPELVNVNHYRNSNPDWIHMNSVAYNERLDQIVLSARWFNEIWIIDHSTTVEQAASHSGGKYGKGGDLLYRWGNPHAYGAGSEEDRRLFAQHDAHWIPEGLPGAGNLMVFNNGDFRNQHAFSTVDEWQTPVDAQGNYRLQAGDSFLPVDFSWSYQGDFSSERISGAQRLPNGNTLICSGSSGHVFEVSPDKQVVWEYRLDGGAEGGRRGAPPPPPGVGRRGAGAAVEEPGEGPEDGPGQEPGGRRNRGGGPPGGGGGGGLFRAPRYAADHPAFEGHELAKLSTEAK